MKEMPPLGGYLKEKGLEFSPHNQYLYTSGLAFTSFMFSLVDLSTFLKEGIRQQAQRWPPWGHIRRKVNH